MLNTHSLLLEAKKFTEAYQQGGDIAQRELACLRVQFPAIFKPIEEDELFVGYLIDPLVGYRYSWSGDAGWTGFFANLDCLQSLAKEDSLSPEDRALAQELFVFWEKNRTSALIKAEYPQLVERDNFRLSEIFTRLAEINLDFDLLLQLGIPGLREHFLSRNAETPKPFWEAELGVLDLLTDCLRFFASDAREKAKNASQRRRAELLRMAQMLEYLTDHAPDSFYSALLLFHLVAMMTTVDNFARMDVYMGDFLVRDLENGTLTREEALEILVNMYTRFGDLFSTSGRIIIAGEGRRNEANADQMALLLLDAAKIVHKSAPTLCLRVYKGMNPALWEKACDTLEAGCSYPLLFNDAVNVPGRMRALHIPREVAQQYIMSNCGEYGIWAQSIHSPNAAICYAKILELVLNNGVDPMNGNLVGIPTGDPLTFDSFDKLLDAFKKQSIYFIERTAECLPLIYKGAAKQSHNLLMSMLYHNSFEEGLGLLEGAKYQFVDIETHAIVLTADALLAIKTVVYDQKKMSMQRLLDALKANFSGYEAERAWLLRAPKFGNAHPEADAMTQQISNFVYKETAKQVETIGVHASTASQITVDGYITFGQVLGATPDGRLAGQPITNSTNPSNGSDKNGIFALLRSMASVDSSLSGGQVCHLKLAPDAFSNQKRGATGAMIASFFEAGGGELSIYTVRQEDLIDAMEHPEKHQNLIVRIGGYNARFVALSKELQEEMIARNAYVS